jgi:hypothetical protein
LGEAAVGHLLLVGLLFLLRQKLLETVVLELHLLSAVHL